VPPLSSCELGERLGEQSELGEARGELPIPTEGDPSPATPPKFRLKGAVGPVARVTTVNDMEASPLALRGSSPVIYSFLTVVSSVVACTLHNDERLSFPHIVLASASFYSRLLSLLFLSLSCSSLFCTQAWRRYAGHA
jgi:hypothetical protein